MGSTRVDISRLTPAERLLLVEELWDSLSLPDPDLIAVTAVMHGRRDPRRWQQR